MSAQPRLISDPIQLKSMLLEIAAYPASMKFLVVKSLNHRFRSFRGLSCYLLFEMAGDISVSFIVDSLKLRDHLWSLKQDLGSLLADSGVCKVVVNTNEFLGEDFWSLAKNCLFVEEKRS
jgi:hypothetical protein